MTAEALDAENAASLVDGADMALFCMQDVAAVAIGVDTCERLGVRCLAVLGVVGRHRTAAGLGWSSGGILRACIAGARVRFLAGRLQRGQRLCRRDCPSVGA